MGGNERKHKMSLPRRDPVFTMADLHAEATKFLAAGHAYFEAAHKAGIGGAVIWTEDTEHGLVIFTRGEYRETLLRNIPELGPVVQYGAAAGDER